MKFNEQAEKIFAAIQMMRKADALIFIEVSLETAFVQGERAGIEAASRAISNVGEAA
jgi:hypothetical protein